MRARSWSMSMAVLALAPCARPPQQATPPTWAPAAAPDMGAVVAQVGEVPIFAAEVGAQAAKTKKPPREALDDLIAFHLLAAAARERGHAVAESGVARARAEAMVQRLLEREFEPRVRREDVPEAELRSVYERVKRAFVHPRLVEIVVLAVYTGARMKPEPRARARKLAAELDAAVRARPVRTAEDFLEIASEPTWRDREVKYMKLFQSDDQPLPAKVGAAVQRLKAAGETTPLIEDETGLYVARYVSEKPAQNRTFEQVRTELLDGYHPRWRQQQFLRFAEGIAERHDARVLGTAGAAPAR